MKKSPGHKNLIVHPAWEMVIFALSVYVLIALFIVTAFKLNPAQVRILAVVDNLICLVFIGDFCYNIYRAKSKLEYLKWGWIDLVSSIPNFQAVRVGRFVRILRILRAIRSVRRLTVFVFRKKSSSTLISVALMAFTLLIFGSVAILNVEHAPNSNIKSASDAIWWSLTTMATVGYGDKFPVTMEGRVIGGILIVAGVALVGTFTAYVASIFIEPKEKTLGHTEDRIMDEIREIKEALKRLEHKKSSNL
jgi:voltage-gated potassium channel